MKNDIRSIFTKPGVTISLNNKSLDALKKYVVEDPNGNKTFMVDSLGSPILYIIEREESADLPILPYAVSIDTGREIKIVCDMRPFINKDGVMRNQSDADIMIVNAYYEARWVSEEYDSIYSETIFAAHIYVSIITKQLTSLYRLEQKDMLLVRVLTALRYIFMFSDPLEKEELTAKVTRITNMPYGDVLNIMESIDDTEILTWSQFCSILKEKSNSVKLARIMPKVIVEVFTKIFYCTDYKAKMMVAIDHPPVWLGVVYAASNDKRFKRTLLGSLMMSLPRDIKVDRDEYIKGINVRINDIRVGD